MVDYREILRLISLRHSNTHIAEALHSFRNTIWEVRMPAKGTGLVGINKCNNKAGRPGMLVTAAGRPSRN